MHSLKVGCDRYMMRNVYAKPGGRLDELRKELCDGTMPLPAYSTDRSNTSLLLLARMPPPKASTGVHADKASAHTWAAAIPAAEVMPSVFSHMCSQPAR